MNNFVPERDGIDHINIYSQGKTELGKLLSNFANTPFTYEPYGTFQSVEGFWYYYFTECRYEYLRDLSGFEAKKAGKKLRNDDYSTITDLDKEIILEAVRCKLRQNRYILKLLIKNTLPLTHYYVYNDKVIDKGEYSWITDEIERIRLLMLKDIVSKNIKNRNN